MSDTAASGVAPPEYLNPPIVELIFAVALQPLTVSVVDLAQFGLQELGSEFPVHQDQPPTQMAIETFDEAVQDLAPTLALLAGPPPIRLWFQSDDKTRLVQLQRDWLAYNWQRGSDETSYPRYDAVEQRFLRTWDSFSDYIEGLSGQIVSARSCELSYINHVVPSGTWAHEGKLHRVIRLASQPDDSLPAPEDGQISFRYRISHEGRDIGRLYVQATPRQRQSDQEPVIQLTLTARGKSLSPGREGMAGFFRLAHEWIGNAFAAVTTREAQDAWGRIR